MEGVARSPEGVCVETGMGVGVVWVSFCGGVGVGGVELM